MDSIDLQYEFLSQILQYGIPILFAYLTGRWLERKHYRSIQAREAAFSDQPTITFLKHTGQNDVIDSGHLVMGSAVISIDYFKRFWASIIKIFGGHMRAYSPLVDRARREALLRMQEQAPDADIIVNVRIETTTIGNNDLRGMVGSVEAMAYGTALKYR